MSEQGAFAREFDVLVARSIRRGRLDVGELLDAYGQLQPGGHPLIGERRCVDLEAMVAALTSLPRVLLDCHGIMVVTDLNGFDHTPVQSSVVPAGYLGDGTLLLEASLGYVSLMNIVAPMCLLAHELNKGHELLAKAGLVTVDSFAIEKMDLFDAPSSEKEEKEEEEKEEDEGKEDEFDDQDQVAAAALARIAFALGVDQGRLEQADDATNGNLVRLLLAEVGLPEILLHHELTTAAISRKTRGRADTLLNTLAEMGLANRRLHLWIGDGVISDCLSPYTRDLRDVLIAWGGANPQSLGGDLLSLDDTVSEDGLYALAHDFLRTDPALHRERAEAERTVGLIRCAVGESRYEIVDLGRVDPRVCDARLSAWHISQPAPVIVRMGLDVEDTGASGLRHLLTTLSGSIASVTLVLDGTTLSGEPGTVLLPQLMVNWAGEEKLFLPSLQPLEIDGLVPAVLRGAMLSAPSAAVLSPSRISELAQFFGIAGIEIGGVGAFRALIDAFWQGNLAAAVFRCAMVNSESTSTGRPCIATLNGIAAVAIATLRQIAAPPPVVPIATPEPPTSRRQEVALPLPGRGFRIKA